MGKQIWKGGALLAPLPVVLITCRGIDRDGIEAENVFTVAWTGILNTVPPKTYISVRKSRFSYDIIKNSGEFVINVPASGMVKEVDYCGIYTGAKADKFDKCGFTLETASNVAAPCIAECPLCLECKVTDVVEMGTHDMFVADILCTRVNEDVIDAEGKLRLDKAKLMAFAHGEYFALGKKIGSFGFSAKKKGKGKNSKKVREDKDEITERVTKKNTDAENKSAKKKFDKKDNDGFSFAINTGDKKITDMKELLEFVDNNDSEDVFSDDMSFKIEDNPKNYGKKYKDSHEKKNNDKKSYGSKARKKYDDNDRLKNSASGGKYGRDGFDNRSRNHEKRSSDSGKKEYKSFDKERFHKDGKDFGRYEKGENKKVYNNKAVNKKYSRKKEK